MIRLRASDHSVSECAALSVHEGAIDAVGQGLRDVPLLDVGVRAACAHIDLVHDPDRLNIVDFNIEVRDQFARLARRADYHQGRAGLPGYRNPRALARGGVGIIDPRFAQRRDRCAIAEHARRAGAAQIAGQCGHQWRRGTRVCAVRSSEKSYGSKRRTRIVCLRRAAVCAADAPGARIAAPSASTSAIAQEAARCNVCTVRRARAMCKFFMQFPVSVMRCARDLCRCRSAGARTAASGRARCAARSTYGRLCHGAAGHQFAVQSGFIASLACAVGVCARHRLFSAKHSVNAAVCSLRRAGEALARPPMGVGS